MMRVISVVFIVFAFSACTASYEDAFVKSYFAVGHDARVGLLEIVYGVNDCTHLKYLWEDVDPDLSPIERSRLYDELNEERYRCERGTTSHALYVGHFVGMDEPQLLHESSRVDVQSGPTTYSDYLGAALWLQPMTGFGERAFDMHSERLARVSETFIEEDRKLGTDPGLIFFSYHPNLTWGVGYIGEEISIAGVAYPLDRNGPLFRVHDVALEPGPFILEAGGSSYDLVVAQRFGQKDFRFDPDSPPMVVAYRPFDTDDGIIDYIVDGCDVIDEVSRSRYFDVVFEDDCIPSSVTFITMKGSDTFRVFGPFEKERLEFQDSHGDWYTFP